MNRARRAAGFSPRGSSYWGGRVAQVVLDLGARFQFRVTLTCRTEIPFSVPYGRPLPSRNAEHAYY